MSNTEFWNARYAEPGFAYGTEPNAFLVAQRPHLKAGQQALAVADGEGRNGVWLAEQGLQVLSVEASEVGLRKTRELAAARGVALRTEQVDLAEWIWPVQRFDIVAAIYVHFPPALRARLHHAMLDALKPGGILILEAFSGEQLKYQSGGPGRAEMLYSSTLLASDFTAGEILALQETVTDLAEGKYHHGPAAVVRLVVRRPGKD